MAILFIMGLVLGALLIIFVAQNITTITVVFLAWSFQGSLAMVLVFAVCGGILLYAFLSLPEVIRKRFVISKLAQENNELKEGLTRIQAEVESEKSKLAANNAYLDGLEKAYTETVADIVKVVA